MTTRQENNNLDGFGSSPLGASPVGASPVGTSSVEVSTQRITRRYVRGLNPARVTRISIESDSNEQVNHSKPRLKKGVRISQSKGDDENSYLVVFSAINAIVIKHPGARAIIAKLDGTHAASDIARELEAPIHIVENVITQLKMAQMLDLTNSKIKLNNRFHSPIAERALHTEDQSNDASFKQLQKRMAPELNQTTWVKGVTDGGVELLSSRQNFGVLIHGKNRLATLIYIGLLASGVTNTKFSITSKREINTIGDADIGTGALRINDFGLIFNSRIDELTREWSLFPTASKSVKGTIAAAVLEREIQVVVGSYTPELIQQFMRDKKEHFLVGDAIGAAANLGPFVIPGQTPCVTCNFLGKYERYGVKGLSVPLTESDELPVALTYQLAGCAVQSILQLIDTGSSDLTGAQMTVNYLTPIQEKPMTFTRHPLCECSWNESTGDGGNLFNISTH